MWKQGWKLVVLIIIAALIFLWLIKAPIMSMYLTNRLGVPVKVRTITMWPSWTRIRYFKIKNPHGYDPRTALRVKKINMEYQHGKLISNPSIIESITLDDVTLNIEIRNVQGSDNNWTVIGAQAPKVYSSRGVIVKKLILKNITVNVTGAGATALGISGSKRFDQLEFDNINSKEGFPTKQLISQIFQGIGFKKFIENFLNPAQRIEKTLNRFNIFGMKDAVEQQ